MANVQKRINKDGSVSYRVKVFRGYAPDGKQLKPYSATWKVPEGLTERQVKAELERFKVKFEEKCLNGDISANGDPKLSDFCKQYFEVKQDALARSTLQTYHDYLDKDILPELGHKKISELRPAHIQSLVHKLSNSKTPKGELVSAGTVKRKLDCLRSVLKVAVQLGIIKDSPADAKYLSVPPVVSKRVEILTKADAIRMFECLLSESLQFQCAIRIALIAGARRGEIMGLQFSDIDFENNKITIKRSATITNGKIEIKPTKDYKERTVSVNQEDIALIAELQKEKEKKKRQLGTAWRGNQWLFTKWDGSLIYPQTISKQWDKFVKRNGLPKVKFHALRHTSATLLLCSSTDVNTVRIRLGHGSLKTTQIYAHLVYEADEQAACNLKDMLITKTDTCADAMRKAN